MRRMPHDLIYLVLASFITLCQPIFANPPSPQVLMPGIALEFNLEPNKRQEFTNFTFQPVNAVCQMTTEDENGNDIFVELLRKKGKINDYPLSAGDNLIVRIRNKDALKITADSGGRVAITNQSLSMLKASCSTI